MINSVQMNLRILLILCISNLAAMIGMGIIVPIFPLYLNKFNISGAMMGVIFSATSLSFAIFNPIMGRIADRIGYKSLIVVGLLIRVPVAVSYVFASNMLFLIFIRLVEGVFVAMVSSSAGAYVAAISPKNKEGSYMGLFNTFFLLGFGAGPLLGGALTDLYDIDFPFYVLAVLFAISAFLVLLLVPERADTEEQRHSETGQKNETSLKVLLSSRLIKGLFIIGFILSFAQGALMVFLPVVAANKQLSMTEIGILTSSLMLFAGFLQMPFGYLANKYNKIFLIISGIVMVSVIVSLIPHFSKFREFFALSLLGAIGTSLGNPAALALLIRAAKDGGFGLGFTIGAFNFAVGSGMIAGPVVSGVIMDVFSLNHLFYAISALCMLSSVIIYYSTRSGKDPGGE